MEQRESHSISQHNQVLLAEHNGDPASSESSMAGLSVGEVCIALYRRKWLIALFALAGLVGAGVIYKTTPRLFRSQAQIMVKYVAERQTVGPSQREEKDGPEIVRGDAAARSEAAILASMDLAKKVATNIGPDRILARLGGGTDPLQAASVINGGTATTVQGGGNVIAIMFDHPDPEVVQPVLAGLIEEYVRRHYEIHRALASLDEFRKERDRLQDEFSDADKQLRALVAKNGVYSMEDAKKAAGAQVFKLEEALRNTRSEVAEREAAVQYIEQQMVSGLPSQNVEERDALKQDYDRINSGLQQARRQITELSGQYTEESGLIQPYRDRITLLEKQRKELEKKDPTLVLSNPTAPGSSQSFDPLSEKLRIALLQKRMGVLTNDLLTAKNEEARLYELERPILELQRKRDILDKNYRYYASKIEEAQLDTALGSSRISNISRVEEPTPPVKVVVPLAKKMGMAVVAGLGLGIGLALLLELFLNQTLRRVTEIERILPVPVYVSIPKGSARKDSKLLRQPTVAPGYQLSNGNLQAAEVTPPRQSWDEPLQPYFAALRDRILNRFESLTRKPKLVGVCGCVGGAEATTTATGLAAALSEAGDLKVLLVDLKSSDRRRDPSLGARKACTLLEALADGKREEGLIAPNLYLATEGDADKQPMMSSPSKFTKVVPQLNASDYDYIVFDLPPVDQVSITPGLAKHMDLTLFVVEAETVQRKTVKHAGSLLLEFTPHVAVVFNEVHSRLPKWLEQRV